MEETIFIVLATALALQMVFKKKVTMEEMIKRNFTRNYWGVIDDD